MNDKISVLMGVYNCSHTLTDAIKSIQKQTYQNWEIILCDDGSTDNTYDIACDLAKNDDRIIVIKNDKNYGLNYTLNHCLSLATGDFIARMDGDDDCIENRFEKQIEFLNNNSTYDIVSSPMILFDENGVWGETKSPEFPKPEELISANPICHAPVMMKKSAIDSVNGYTIDRRALRCEDVDLWIKLYAAGYKCYNIQEPLYRMRNDKNALNRRKYKYRINSTYVRLKGCKQLNLGIKCYFLAFRPMINGLVPAKLRQIIRKKQFKHI